jgi:type IV secretory pathway VirJ component
MAKPPRAPSAILLFAFIFILTMSGLSEERTLAFGRFGTVYLYFESPRPSRVVLFVSGDGGWNLGVVDMARSLASLDALVIGIDIVHYLQELAGGSEPCGYPAGDFEQLSQFVQKELNFPDYISPVLVGYSSGATLIYAILVQAPSTTFRGGLSLGFCPDLTLDKPLCRGSGLEWNRGKRPTEYIFQPASTLEVPWAVLQGEIDRVCDPALTERYVKQVKKGDIIALPKVGHGFAVQRNWMPQFREAFKHIFQEEQPPPEIPIENLAGLPLIEVPSQTGSSDFLAVHLTGDGGWGVTDKGLSGELAKQGIPVVGLNSLKYFWTRRTPNSASQDLARILNRYTEYWRKRRVILIGYSLGADVLPFMFNRLPAELQEKVASVVLLGPSPTVEFEFHVTDWLGKSPGRRALPVLPEVEKITKAEIICFYGEEDKENICGEIDPKVVHVKVISLPTGHRFGRDFGPIAEAILSELKKG